MAETPTRLFTVGEAADYIQEKTGMADLTPRWVYNQITRGLIGCVVVHNRRRVSQKTLDTLIAGWLKKAA